MSLFCSRRSDRQLGGLGADLGPRDPGGARGEMGGAPRPAHRDRLGTAQAERKDRRGT